MRLVRARKFRDSRPASHRIKVYACQVRLVHAGLRSWLTYKGLALSVEQTYTLQPSLVTLVCHPGSVHKSRRISAWYKPEDEDEGCAPGSPSLRCCSHLKAGGSRLGRCRRCPSTQKLGSQGSPSSFRSLGHQTFASLSSHH